MRKCLELIFVSLISISATLYFVSGKPKVIDGGSPETFKQESQVINVWKRDVSSAFDEAEIKVYNIQPKPDIVGPHEDPKKCICKGSGVIKQGDGHTTPCPYHSKEFTQPFIILEE